MPCRAKGGRTPDLLNAMLAAAMRARVRSARFSLSLDCTEVPRQALALWSASEITCVAATPSRKEVILAATRSAAATSAGSAK
jgi:hypothetical protein